VSFRGDRLAVSPIELSPDAAAALREELPEATFDSGRSTVNVNVPGEPSVQLAGVVAAAEAILKTATTPEALR
jgi:transcription-repair coupling factor (superfamily II helicase)